MKKEKMKKKFLSFASHLPRLYRSAYLLSVNGSKKLATRAKTKISIYIFLLNLVSLSNFAKFRFQKFSQKASKHFVLAKMQY